MRCNLNEWHDGLKMIGIAFVSSSILSGLTFVFPLYVILYSAIVVSSVVYSTNITIHAVFLKRRSHHTTECDWCYFLSDF